MGQGRAFQMAIEAEIPASVKAEMAEEKQRFSRLRYEVESRWMCSEMRSDSTMKRFGCERRRQNMSQRNASFFRSTKDVPQFFAAREEAFRWP